MVQYLKYVFFVVGFIILMVTNFIYNNRIAGMPDRTAPYDLRETRLRFIGYGCFGIALVLIVLFN